jgi:hypothetical protein
MILLQEVSHTTRRIVYKGFYGGKSARRQTSNLMQKRQTYRKERLGRNPRD